MAKYPMKAKTDTPLFNYLVRDSMSLNYYLFAEFDDALKQAQTMSINGNKLVFLYENYFHAKTREWHGQNTFQCRGGKVIYDKHAKADLHLEHYVNAGEWLNPNPEWIERLEGLQNEK